MTKEFIRGYLEGTDAMINICDNCEYSLLEDSVYCKTCCYNNADNFKLKDESKLFVIAIDFDGTLYNGDFENLDNGTLNKRVFTLLDELKFIYMNKGYDVKLILWTCREDVSPKENYLTQAVEWCKKHYITFDAINKNPWNHWEQKYPTKGRKILYDLLIDDKCLGIKEFL